MGIKTEKQVISGMHRPVCMKCRRELHPEKNGVVVLDLDERGNQIELYEADLWKCPGCGMEVVGGFAWGCMSGHWEKDFQSQIDRYRAAGLLVENRG